MISKLKHGKHKYLTLVAIFSFVVQTFLNLISKTYFKNIIYILTTFRRIKILFIKVETRIRISLKKKLKKNTPHLQIKQLY